MPHNNLDENRWKIERGQTIEKVWKDLKPELEDKAELSRKTLEDKSFDDLSEVSKLQGRIQAFKEITNLFEGWIEEKDDIIQKRRDNN